MFFKIKQKSDSPFESEPPYAPPLEFPGDIEDKQEKESTSTKQHDYVDFEKEDDKTSAPKHPQKEKAKSRSRFRKQKKPKEKSDRKFLKLIWAEKALLFDIFKGMKSSVFKLITCFKIDKLNLNLLIATTNPALTGALFGGAQSFLNLPRPINIEIAVNADYLNSEPKAELYLLTSVRPLSLMNVSLITAFSLPWVRITKTGWRLWRESKREKQDNNKD